MHKVTIERLDGGALSIKLDGFELKGVKGYKIISPEFADTSTSELTITFSVESLNYEFVK